MASEAFAGVGTKFQRWDGAAWQDIAEVNSIDGPGMTKDVLEVTSLDTDAGYNEFITGFAEGGTLTLDMNFTRETYELMKEDFESDEVRSYRIQLPDYDSEPSTFTIEGLVIELPITMTADDKVTADVVIQITSQVVLDVGSTVPAEESEIVPESSDLTPVESSDLDDLYAALNDGNTVVLLLFEEGVTVADTDKVELIANLMGSSGWNVAELGDSDASRPTLTSTGILFDGIDDVMKMASAQTALSQPNTIYYVYKNISYTSARRLVSFGSANAVDFRQYGTGGRIAFYTSAALQITADYSTLGARAIATVVLNGASSSLQLNKSPLVTGDLSTRTINILWLGSDLAGGNKSNHEFVGLIIRNGVDSDSKRAEIWNALNDRYVHHPISATVEDASPMRVDLAFNEELDEDTLTEIGPTDFQVTTRTVSSLTLSANKKVLQLNLTTPIDQAWSGQVIFTQSSAGGITTAKGDPIPYCWIPVVNNVVD